VRPLDIAAMQAAAVGLVGSHDFATFGQPPQGEGTVRNVYTAEWQAVTEDLPPLGDYPGRRLVFTITANAFLRQMVRSIVGSLLAVGRGEWSIADLQEALTACDRNRSAPPAPPQGLVLEKVTYPGDLDALIHGK
jgi:tRNA pseudouridine38-40 synthase